MSTKCWHNLSLFGKSCRLSASSYLLCRPVHKFKRRPQYLEYFVYLASSTMMQGKNSLVLDNWAEDVFRWLARRNEVILSARVPYQPAPDTKPRGLTAKKRVKTGGRSRQSRVPPPLPEEGDSLSSSKHLLPMIEHKAVMARPVSVRKAERVSACHFFSTF